MSANTSTLLYLVSAIFFIFSLQGLSSAKTSKQGNLCAMAGMSLAIVVSFSNPSVYRYGWILSAIVLGGGIGSFIARRIQMTALPQLVAAFHSLVGIVAVFVAASAFYAPQVFQIGILGNIRCVNLIEMGIGTIIGALTFSGSVVAFLKLQGLLKVNMVIFQRRHLTTLVFGVSVALLLLIFVMTQSSFLFWVMTFMAMVLGVLLVMPIGGADMPVIVSMLNSYSGWAASGIGLTLSNPLLIITGALVGSSGAILSYIMCRGMNRSILNVLIGGIDNIALVSPASNKQERSYQASHPEDAAYILKNASSVIIVPGYGMAVAKAQHVVSSLASFLKGEGISVRYAIHPVAGRMPGHMNVLLAEANVSYDDVFELDDINNDFASTDVVIVIGANDITNPAAKTDSSSAIYGMPILDVDKARVVFFIKRSLGSGYAGVDNELFYRSNVMMVLGDGKRVCEDILKCCSNS